MKFVYYQIARSPHVLPLVQEMGNLLGIENVRYVCQGELDAQRIGLGWSTERPFWLISFSDKLEEARQWTEDCPCMVCGIRDFDLIERRLQKGLVTIYASERWFKPVRVGRGNLQVPGCVRLLHPRFLKMALRLRKLVKTYPRFHLLPVGVHAVRDMRLCGIPVSRMTTWGYFVAPAKEMARTVTSPSKTAKLSLKVLWVGRMLDWKRVDVLIKAAAGEPLQLDVYGDGPMRKQLQNMAEPLGNVHFHNPISIAQVRELMRSHDVYVLSSDAGEGWGAVVNEALEEGMVVLGTHEAGASATMLRDDYRFAAGDVKGLKVLLRRVGKGLLSPQGIGPWSAAQGAERLLTLVREKLV